MYWKISNLYFVTLFKNIINMKFFNKYIYFSIQQDALKLKKLFKLLVQNFMIL